jgi:hypothetical protein
MGMRRVLQVFNENAASCREWSECSRVAHAVSQGAIEVENVPARGEAVSGSGGRAGAVVVKWGQHPS